MKIAYGKRKFTGLDSGINRILTIYLPVLFYDKTYETVDEGIVMIIKKQSVGINKPVTESMIRNFIHILNDSTVDYSNYKVLINHLSTLEDLISDPDEGLDIEGIIELFEERTYYSENLNYIVISRVGDRLKLIKP